jgi:hypothetical protein
MEAAPELVTDATIGHLRKREADHRAGRHVAGGDAPQLILERHRLRELGRATPRSVASIEPRVERRVGDPEEPGVDDGLAARDGGAGSFSQGRDQSLARGAHLSPLRLPRLGDALEDLRERRHPMAGLIREVRPTVKRLAFRRQEDGHRPAAAAGHRLDGVHVDRVEIGPLLTIDLDRDEPVIQQPRRGLVLERLALHDVTPMAGGVADRQEDRTVQELRSSERIGAPRHPIDRVVRMLK